MMHNNAYLVPIYFAKALNAGDSINRLWLRAGWSVLFIAPTREITLAKMTRLNSMERVWNNEGEWTWKAENRTSEKFMPVVEACGAIFWRNPGLKWRTISALGSQQTELQFLRPQYPTEGHRQENVSGSERVKESRQYYIAAAADQCVYEEI